MLCTRPSETNVCYYYAAARGTPCGSTATKVALLVFGLHHMVTG